jgi:hypothetical protein
VNARRWVPLVLVFLLSLVLLPAATGAQEAPPGTAASPDAIPALIYPLFSYQGRLVEGGTPVTGNRSMTFSLWTAGSGGASVWSEGPKVVTVNSGLFTVTLGDTSALPVNWFAYELWLQVQVGATTLPRQRLMGAPYAMSLAPGAQVLGSKTASDPAIVTVENAGAGTALSARADDGNALYATSSGGSYATLQVANTDTTFGPAAQIDSSGSSYTMMVTNSYTQSGSNAGGVLRLMTNGGRVVLVQNKSFTQLFSVEANGDVTQSRDAGGLIKFAIAAYCGDDDATIYRYYTHGIIPTVTAGASAGPCTIDVGFDPSNRYWTVTAPASGSLRLASCAVSGGDLVCVRQNIDGIAYSGEIQVLIY